MKFLISIKRYTFVTRAAFSRASVREHASTEQLKMTAALMFSIVHSSVPTMLNSPQL